MENLVVINLFSGVYKDKTVLITGHTGFKGSWLAYWLNKMGANVIGYSLEAPTSPNHYSLLDFNIISIIADINDQKKLKKTFLKYKPDIVFHLAAQPLVRQSYTNPIETFETNVIGTLKVFEACRNTPSVKVIVNITTDKCYENMETDVSYKENDKLGGYDPYSSSKACSEILTSSYRNSFFNLKEYKIKHNTLLASCRAGNVIGGGDWAQDRILTDIMISIKNKNDVILRNPNAVRPWQHVLEPLSGYLLLGQKLLEGKKEYSGAWNFGPKENSIITVKDLTSKIKQYWDDISIVQQTSQNNAHEASLLLINSSKANNKLSWNNVWNTKKTIKYTTNWYKEFYTNQKVSTEKDLTKYINDAKKKSLIWTK